MADRSGFTGFVEEHSGYLLRSAYLLTQDWGRAEDLLQTALAKAWLAWGRISDDPTPYVYRILTNTHASWWRRRWRGEVPTEQLPEPAAPDPTTALDDRDAMWTALARLSARQRAVVVLHYFEAMPLSQIARILGCSPSSVSTQLRRALTKLRVDPALSNLEKVS